MQAIWDRFEAEDIFRRAFPATASLPVRGADGAISWPTEWTGDDRRDWMILAGIDHTIRSPTPRPTPVVTKDGDDIGETDDLAFEMRSAEIPAGIAAPVSRRLGYSVSSVVTILVSLIAWAAFAQEGLR